MNATHPGLRSRDYDYILGLGGLEIYKGDYWMGEDASGNELPAEKNSSDGYKYGIAKSDVIVTELGGNDISNYLIKNAEKLFEIIGGLMSSNNTAQENAVLADMQEDVLALEQAKTEDQANKGTLKLFSDLAKLKESSKPYIEILDFLVTSIGEAAIDFRCYWNQLMNYVSKHKKDDAVVLALGIGNPFKGLENMADLLEGFFGTGGGIDVSKISKIITLIITPFVLDMNNYYRKVADKYDYTFVAMPDNDMLSVVTGEYDPYDGVYLDTEVTYMVHPHHKGQDQIVKALQKAYKKEMLKRGKVVTFQDVETAVDKCKHANSEIQNVAEATYLAKGYTGDKVCTDCGAYFYKGQGTPKLEVAKTSIKKLTKGNDSFTVKWSKKNVTGYQVQYSTSSKFNNAKKVTVNGATTKTVKKLKSGKKYYVRVRSFLTVQDNDGKDVKVYSKWSAKKSVTTK